MLTWNGYNGQTFASSLIDPKPESLIPADAVEWTRKNVKNVKIVYVGEGIHNLQEDRPSEIGAALTNRMDRGPMSSLMM